MKIVRLDDGPAVRLALRGELDLATTDLVTEAAGEVLSADPSPQKLLIDLDALTFCDSSGIDVLLTVQEEAEARGVAFRVVRVRGIVRRSFSVTGVLNLLTGRQTV
ncbi:MULTISPECIES: STAS domain-containing protein [Actinoplanes]|uniref:STAS domain-containing protein n=1 Tax=Actinoplanes TaxID=1865 RepID=UPI000A83E630|nr:MULTISPECIES: STAS domain-containing protein [Actinoplanes]GLY04221.1 anti-sigma factor antagonist [Actinoplanes sp. NBRC 101535]